MEPVLRLPWCLFAVGLLLLPATVRGQDTDITIGQRRSLRSVILGEERPYWVYVPPSYDDTRYELIDYPVLFLLDATSTFTQRRASCNS